MGKYDIEMMRRLYDEWESSGLSMKAFSLKNNINPATFNYWAKAVKKGRQRQQPPPSGFLQLSLPNDCREVVATITFPSGAKLDLYRAMDASLIKELVG